MSNPTTRNIEAYFENTYGLVYVFETSAGGAFDIASNFTTLSFKIFTKNNEASPLVELDLDSGFTISDTNRLVGEITAAQNETLFGSPIKYYQMTVTYNGDTETILKGIYVVNRAQSGSANDTALTLTVSLAPFEVSVSVADNAFLALDAKNDAVAAKDLAVTTVNNALSDIESARVSALSTISTAETNSITAINTASSNGVTAVQNAQTQGVTAVESARDSAISQINDLVVQAQASADEATAQAGIATTQANTSTTQAGIATTQAGIATNQATTATTQAGIATTEANRAETEADRAEAEANISETTAFRVASLFDDVNNMKYGNIVAITNEASANIPTPPSGVAYIFYDSGLKIKLSNGTIV